MRISLACLLALCALPAGVMAQDAPVHDKPAVRGSIIANLLQDHDNPFCSIPMRATICSIRGPAISIKSDSQL
jgi:phospholipase A1